MSERLKRKFNHLISDDLETFDCPCGWEPILECLLEFVELDNAITGSETEIYRISRHKNTLIIYLLNAPHYVQHRASFASAMMEMYCSTTGHPIKVIKTPELTWKK
jgi:hypothetical protein